MQAVVEEIVRCFVVCQRNKTGHLHLRGLLQPLLAPQHVWIDISMDFVEGPRTVGAGDCVLMRSADTSKPPYVAKVESIEAAGSRGTNVRVRVRWYYRPEESIGGRRPFHGSKEVFLSDHYDVQSADTIEGKCNVHSFRSYTKLDSVNAEDFFCRFDYKSASGSFVPDRIAVFCKCEMPYNPDDLMIQCEECSDWFHPSCIGMTIKEAKKREHFFCQSCTAENGKTTENFHEATAESEEKLVESKRRRR